MAKFAYNNTKNANTGHTLFKLSYKYYSKVFLQDETNFCLRFYSAKILVDELRELIKISYQNLLYTHELHKRAYNK